LSDQYYGFVRPHLEVQTRRNKLKIGRIIALTEEIIADRRSLPG
jgi:hypothetical protein